MEPAELKDSAISVSSKINFASSPNMGTQNLNKTIPPSITPPSNLDELFNEYKQYKMLKKKDDMSSSPEAGEPAYVVSIKWLKRYS